MNNEQEIERIEKILHENTELCGIDVGCSTGSCSKCLAKELVKEGIGDKKQAVKEAFEKLRSRLELQCEAETDSDIESRYVDAQTLFNTMRELFTELYGGESK